jgi:hypothetical protein
MQGELFDGALPGVLGEWRVGAGGIFTTLHLRGPTDCLPNATLHRPRRWVPRQGHSRDNYRLIVYTSELKDTQSVTGGVRRKGQRIFHRSLRQPLFGAVRSMHERSIV